MKNIATSLVKAQKEFGPALKTATNPHFRSKYADLASCVEAVMDALNNNGIYLLQKTHDQQNGIMVETVFVHESGEMLNCGNLYFPASKNDAQGFMSALTYARRGSLMAACGIAPEDDDGNAASRKPSAPTPDITDHLSAIEASATSDELATLYKAALDACQGNQALQAKVISAKKARVERAKQEKAA
jgi:hypothetical protein